MLCDQCDALVINGILCHEHGCPNVPRPTPDFPYDYGDEEEEYEES